MKRLLNIVAALAIALGSLLPAVPVHADTSVQPITDGNKALLCHATDSVTNPYSLIFVSYNAAGAIGHGNGDHYSHKGEIFDPTHDYKGNAGWGDIIPPLGTHAGLNWTAEGQALYASGCGTLPMTTAQCIEGTQNATITLTNRDNNTITVSYQINGGDWVEKRLKADESFTVNATKGDSYKIGFKDGNSILVLYSGTFSENCEVLPVVEYACNALSVTPIVDTMRAKVDNFEYSAQNTTLTSVSINWGDNTAAQVVANALNAEHTYAAAGTYTVTATLTFGAGQTAQCQDTVTIEEPVVLGPAVIEVSTECVESDPDFIGMTIYNSGESAADLQFIINGEEYAFQGINNVVAAQQEMDYGNGSIGLAFEVGDHVVIKDLNNVVEGEATVVYDQVLNGICQIDENGGNGGENTTPTNTNGHVLGAATSRTTAKTLPNTGTVNVLSTVALFAALAVTIITVSQLVKMQLSRRSD